MTETGSSVSTQRTWPSITVGLNFHCSTADLIASATRELVFEIFFTFTLPSSSIWIVTTNPRATYRCKFGSILGFTRVLRRVIAINGSPWKHVVGGSASEVEPFV